MFNRLKRAYYAWRIRLTDCGIRDAKAELYIALTCGDIVSATDHEAWLEILLSDRRYFQYQLARTPQPT